MLEELLQMPTDKCNVDRAIYLVALFKNAPAFYDIYYLLCVAFGGVCPRKDMLGEIICEQRETNTHLPSSTPLTNPIER